MTYEILRQTALLWYVWFIGYNLFEYYDAVSVACRRKGIERIPTYPLVMLVICSICWLPYKLMILYKVEMLRRRG